MTEIFQNVLTASFHGSIVILAVILLRLALKKTPKKFLCLLWLLAGIRLLMPFEIQSGLSLQPDVDTIRESVIAEEVPGFAPYHPAEMPAQNFPNDLEHDVMQDTPAEVLISGEMAAQIPQTAAEAEDPLLTLDAVAANIWIAVAFCFLLYTIGSYIHLKLQVREAIRIRGNIWECDRIETAFILGFIRPQIYLPMGMSRNNRGHILAHERTHLEKGDHWIKMIGFIALSLHWFNPLVWVAYWLLCKDIEMACDERVVQFMELEERKSYSAALINCSTDHAHFSACPVAFGEVSVKNRVLSVLNYKKPSFWISLLGVIAIAFVAFCLLTNPMEKNPENLPAETVETQPLTPQEREALVQDKEEELLAKVNEGIAALLNGNDMTYRLAGIDEDSGVPWQCTVQNQGENCWWALYDYRDGGQVEKRYLKLDGVDYEYHDPVWIPAETAPEETLPGDIAKSWFNWADFDTLYNFREVEITRSDGETYHQIKITASNKEPHLHAEYTFEFNDDGRLLNGEVEGMDSPYGVRLALTDDTGSQNMMDEMNGGSVFDRARETMMSRAEYESSRIPSNMTEYDRDFMLGSGQMRWYFFDGAWQFACGAENITDAGLTMFYCESGDNHHTVMAEEGFWLEVLKDENWILLDKEQKGAAPAEQIQVSWSERDTVSINWADTYGDLPAGYYRLGRYHTVTMPNGDTDTQHAYVKFRVYDAAKDDLLAKCRTALNNLISGNSYHLYTFDWLKDMNAEHCLSQEYWKHGEDYLEVTRYPLRENPDQMKEPVQGELWRGGKSYWLSWEGEPLVSQVSQWSQNRPGYVDGSNLDMWTFGMEWSDARVSEVYRDGNDIHILQDYDFDDRYECTDLTVTLDDKGDLKGIVRSYLPTRNCKETDSVIAEELVVFDTVGTQIRKIIDSVDLSKPLPFSWESDAAANPEAQRIGFRNKTAKAVKTPEDALALAHEECTLPPLMEFDKGYCQSQIWYDETADMWKVHLFWWQHDSAQTIYMNSDGLTQMIITVK